MFNLTIFKDYDVRGTYPDQINGEVARAIAHAIVRKFNPKTVCICRDMRLSGAEIRDGFAEVFQSLGIDVFDAGLTGTEVQYYIAGTHDYELVIMISASHNPPEYNGIKLVKKGPVAVTSESGLFEVRDLIAKGPLANAPQKGALTKIEVLSGWKDKVLSLVDVKSFKPLSVVVDAGNGMGGKLFSLVSEKLPLKVTPLFFELDGSFPNHVPNPLIEKNNESLIKTIKEKKADVGVTFDGDADRMFLVDDRGRFVSGTITSAILARHFLQKYPGELVLYNAICGKIVPETIERYGGKSKRVRVGHSYIKTYMRETGAILAVEHSGHYFYREFFMAESGALSALEVISLLSTQPKKLSQLVDELLKYFASGEINFVVSDLPIVVKTIESKYQDAESKDDIDGLSLWYKDHWFNVRASKTEPLLRLNV